MMIDIVAHTQIPEPARLVPGHTMSDAVWPAQLKALCDGCRNRMKLLETTSGHAVEERREGEDSK